MRVRVLFQDEGRLGRISDRRGEIENLRWEQVDLDAGFITLRPGDTKTNEGRRIPISPALV